MEKLYAVIGKGDNMYACWNVPKKIAEDLRDGMNEHFKTDKYRVVEYTPDELD